ncbi:disease resistance protein Roq1 isoform X2 [Cryptomeria japonica]|uniref:disease resistance protein Roq1 isoform X2 n=1 Tax=Cryptomeria japonica TaxID=3369 RepID=UPI0027DA4483|nr:disease resistance protein Roq1 isoform X2 [Cryptomeria japonica]
MASTSTSGREKQERDPFLALEPSHGGIKSSLTAKQFYVFINHRGPDVKKTLAQQLYDSLKEAGIPAYLDSEETELGDSISSTIKNAIYSARVHIAILSPRYAESPWCLAELALMFQTKARIIPLFYQVDPSDFRHIKGRVADAFSKHEEKNRYPKDDIEQWKVCLKKVSEIKGYEFKGQNKSLWNSILEYIMKLLSDYIGIRLSSTGSDQKELCNGVVSAVMNEKQKRIIPFQVAKYEVGLDKFVNDFHSHCRSNGQMIDKIIGIYGMGGSGKTTLAKYLFNQKHSEFSGSTFLFDVRERQVKGELTSLQSRLLKDLLHLEGNTVSSIEDGIAVIKDNLERSRESRFLIVIDDVDNQQQLDALLPTDALNPNSLVIVTTRDEGVLIQARVIVRYKMKEMNRQHSRELFCWHAFHRQSCRSGYDNLVDSFVNLCKGSPLALKVMAAHVFGRDKAYWKLQLDVVKARLHKDIRDTLKISYDALEEDEKQIFMDIACFFIGKDVSMAISIWKASRWRAEHALQTLKDKSLVETESEVSLGTNWYEPPSYFRMHDHLRDLGRELADNEMNHPRRLWRPEDLIDISEIKGFQNILMRSEGNCFRCYSCIQDKESGLYMTCFLESSRASTDLRWFELNGRIPEWIPLQNLHTLKVEGESPSRLWQRDDQVLRKLKELYCVLRAARTNFIQLNKLVSSFGMLKNLERLQLEFENGIFKRNIEWNCLLKSVRELTNLKTLELMHFQLEGDFALSNSGEATNDPFCMGSLEAITLCGAFKTRRVSIDGQSCPILKTLKLYSMKDLIEVDVTGVRRLECLMLFECREMRKVLVNDLPYLEMFQMKFCRTMTELPNFVRVSYLKRICISRCRNLRDISAIERLKLLKRIWIADCPELESIKAIEPLKRLKRIFINECKELQGAICLEELKALKSVFIGNCPRLQNIYGMKILKCLESIVITGCPQLQNIEGVEELKGLKEMIIADAPIISCVETLQC